MIMASCPINHFTAIDGETMETVRDFLFFSSKITTNGDLKLKKHLLLERKAMTNLESTLKSRDITLPTKVQIVKNYWFFQWSCMDVRAGP